MQVLSFVELRKKCKQKITGAIPLSLFIMSDASTQHLATAIQGTAIMNNIFLDVVNADYNQIEALTLDGNSELYNSNPEYVLLYMCTEKLYDNFCMCDDKSRFAEKTMDVITRYWTRISDNIKTKIIQFTFVENDDNIYGNYGFKQPQSFIFQLKKLNYLLAKQSSEEKNVFLIDLNRIVTSMGIDRFRDTKLYYTAKIPIALNALPEVAANVIDVIMAIQGKVRKCIILDLDNTIWGGVVGDDGIEGIQIGDLGIGRAFSEFQMWLKELKKRGIILCICSKNNEETAKLPFEKHPEMVLRLDDISVFVANWDDKVSNIRLIQKTLNIGLDSMVFIDDNEFERNLVRSMIPEIIVPELPKDPADYLSYIKNLNLFETASFSEADKDRTKQYQNEFKRKKLQDTFQTYDEYLENLNMVASAFSFDKFQCPRIAQLTQRSNQFNLRTLRYTEDEVLKLLSDSKYITKYFTLSDRFGEHGLISLYIMEKQSEEALFITNWLMSCRVLRRGMEAFVVNDMVETARECGYKRIIGEYIKTPKNSMVEHIYEDYGFEKTGGNIYTLEIDKYISIKTFISKENLKNDKE